MPKEEEQVLQRGRTQNAQAMELIKTYTSKWGLSAAAELKMFEHPQAMELIKMYISRHSFHDEVELKMLENPQAVELLKMYIS